MMRQVLDRRSIAWGAVVFITASLTGCGGSDESGAAERSPTSPGQVGVTPAQAAAGRPLPATVRYNRDIRPILSDKCFACHGLDAPAREAELRLDVPEDGAGYYGAHWVIEPGEPDASELIARINHRSSKMVMPPPSFHVTLTDVEKRVLALWIEQGAEYEQHWAFTPVARPGLPETSDDGWARSGIDVFVLAQLQANGLEPADPAPLHTLARRVALDLTGLPPEPALLTALLESADPEAAYQTFVDELLASPRFGERMATVWLDAARFADTNGYLHDHVRTQWPWRDWVIQAYNDNLPYDQFIRDQIAGDLLPDATPAQIIATGFNRNHGITTEGGVIREEYRIEIAADRTNTFGAAVLGLTIECARCHDHKYDPISQEDYFSLFAFFNSIDENPAPENNNSPAHAPVFEAPGTGVSVMVMRESDTPRETFVLQRGEYDKPMEDRRVSRRVPAALGSLPEGVQGNRLGLAQWLTSRDNPLVARVEINRIWQTIFGVGLVKTSEDFGMQGEWPSHPELLDWLAVEFIDSGWDRKAIIRMIVTSATYRQSSNARPDLEEDDPENRLLARMSRIRLPAEAIRDQALAVSGLLDGQVGGVGVRPYQPPGLWREGANEGSNTGVFHLGQGTELYRRSVYTFWKRTSPPPQMVLFDAPARDACTLRRGSTNTSLQALLLMNDTQHLEAARMLAARVLDAAGSDADRLDTMYRLCLSRSPRDEESAVLLEGLAYFRGVYEGDPTAAQAFLSLGTQPLPQGIVLHELAAWTMAASTIMNLDEMITRP